ncbi:protein phosphatase 1E-like isoform X2 [Gigantopelta aegis]|uniref:protein phosphatase 1E-like isoform X2 n=1 Tax=Gigantopelta aegis TaxID=1735272 RepID=UPI001B88D148|nr:protein phosphatase 1E-like isoform X2 [Gigantopelta aegis]
MADPKSSTHRLLFKKFLDRFCSEVDTPACDEDNLPLKLYSPSILPCEVEGECLNWVLQYLSCHDCPQLLAPHVARSVYVHVSKTDLSKFSIPEDDDTDDTEDEDRDAKNNDAQQMSNSEKPKPQIPQLDTGLLLKEVLMAVHDICKQWQQALPHLHVSPRVFETSTHAIKNTRRKMEDIHIVIPDLNSLYNLKEEPAQSFYAVFDGHGGVNAAVYSSCHLHTNMIRDPNFTDDASRATRRAYAVTDERFTDRARKGNLRSGTTCIAVLIRGSTLHVSWLGDSQAILVKNGNVISIMEPHKPEREDERTRIEALGGYVIFFGAWRVNGNIAVSRAIGDISQKPFVCSDADVVSFDLDGDEDYMVLACDGVWDVLQAIDIPDIVYTHVKEHGSKTGVARAIVNQSKDSGSNDNISVIVVFFRDDIAEPQGSPLVRSLSENGTNNYKVFDFGDGKKPGDGSSNSTDGTGLNNGTGNDSVSTHGKKSKEDLPCVQESLRTTSENVCSHGDRRNTLLTSINKAASQKSSSLSSQVWGLAVSSYDHNNNGSFTGKKKWTSKFRKNRSGRRKNVKLPKIRRLNLPKDLDHGSFSHPTHTVLNHRLNLAAKNSHPSAVFRHSCAISENTAAVLTNILNENVKKSAVSSVTDVCSLPHLSGSNVKVHSIKK